MGNLCAQCPGCNQLIGFSEESLFSDDDDDDGGLVTCPRCLREFNPYGPRSPSPGASDFQGIESLTDVHREQDDDDDFDDEE